MDDASISMFDSLSSLALLWVALTSAESKQRWAERIVRQADRLAHTPWQRHLQRASLRAARWLGALYGVSRHGGGGPFSRYMTRQSFATSGVIATTYLVLGAGAVAGYLLMTGQGKDDGLTARALGVVALACCLLGVGWAWKTARQPAGPAMPANQKLSALVRCALLTVALPMLAGNLSNALQAHEARDSADNTLLIMAFGFLGLILPFYFGLRGLMRAFDVYVPVALFAFVPLSACVMAGTLAFPSSRGVGGVDLPAAAGIAGVALLCLPAVPQLAARWKKTAFAVAVLGTALCLAPLWAQRGVLTREFFAPGLSLGVMHLAVGICISTLVAIVYANAFCDSVSVAVTRALLVPMSRTRRGRSFWGYVALDAALALALMAATYLLFAALMHVVLWLSPLQGDRFLQALRSVDAWFGVDDATAGLEDATRWLGVGLGRFVFLFGLSAVLPTVFHLVLIAAWATARAVLSTLAMPARALSVRWQAMLARGDAARRDAEGRLVTVSAVLAVLALYGANHALKQLLELLRA